MDEKLLKSIIDNSRNTVCLLGVNVSMDCGCMYYHDAEIAMDIEATYGNSPEEIFSASFYNTRTRQFFEFYQKELLDRPGTPGPCLKTLAKMEADGKLQGIITREIFGLAERAGCKNVINLHGSIYKNQCPHCKREYDIEYMRTHKPIPLCEDCNVPVRPQVRLVGEMLNNGVVTKAADIVSNADVLMVLGCNLTSMLGGQFLKYYKGDHLILINKEPHFSDTKADYVIHGKPRDILPLIYK